MFAKYPFDEYEDRIIIRAMEEYAKQERAEAFSDGEEAGVKENAPSDETIEEIKSEHYAKGYNDAKYGF